MDVFLKPKNIIVAGGGSGIGYAAAQRLLNGGAENVILASRNLQKLQDASSRLQRTDGQKVLCVSFDISAIQSHNEMIEKAQLMLGDRFLIDGLVISSGVNFDGSNWKGFNISEEDWD